MSFGERERAAFIFTTFVTSVPGLAPAVPMRHLLAYIKDVYADKRAFIYLDAKGSVLDAPKKGTGPEHRKILYLADIDLPERGPYATLLFNFADRDVPDPSFLNIDELKIRTAAKLPQEGVSYSAHLLMALTPTKVKGQQYRAVLEKVPHLGRSALQLFMNRMLRNIAKQIPEDFVFDSPQTSKKTEFHPKLEFELQPTSTLREDLSKGVVSHIELVDHHMENEDFDEEGYTRVQSRRMKLRVVKNPDGPAVLRWIDRIKSMAKSQGYDHIQVRFRRTDEGRDVLAPIPTVVADAADAMYCRLELLSFDKKLAGCVAAIDATIQSRLLELIKTDGLWA